MNVNTGRESRLELHSGRSRGRKRAAVALLLPCMFVLTPLVTVLIGIGLGSVGRAWWGVTAGVAIGLWWEWVWVSSLLRILRSAAWLERVTLVVRGPYATRRCCLATAGQVRLRVPQLSASDPGTGRTVRLSLVDPATRRLLAPPKLRALADAIAAPSPRGQGSASAWQVAGMLRELAAERDVH